MNTIYKKVEVTILISDIANFRTVNINITRDKRHFIMTLYQEDRIILSSLVPKTKASIYTRKKFEGRSR